MWGSWLRRAAVPVAILAGSELGHAIVYSARFGLDAGGRQATGAHAYLPALAGGLSAVLGTVLMTSLLVVVMARSLRPGPELRRTRATTRFFDLLPVLFVAQVAIFMSQETIEGLVAGGAHLPSVVELLFWGTLGQLPAALVATCVVTWLLTRLDAAWAAIADGAALLVDQPPAPAVERAAHPEPGSALRLASAFPSAFRKRGPPLCPNP